MRLLVLIAACGMLLLAGCGGPADEQAAAAEHAEQPDPQPQQLADPQEEDTADAKQEEPALGQEERSRNNEDAKTPIVRALLDAIDEEDDEDDDVRDELRDILWGADEELSQVLGENPRRLIEQANKRAPAPMIVPPPRPNAEPEPEAE